jgi:hypothetical protein
MDSLPDIIIRCECCTHSNRLSAADVYALWTTNAGIGVGPPIHRRMTPEVNFSTNTGGANASPMVALSLPAANRRHDHAKQAVVIQGVLQTISSSQEYTCTVMVRTWMLQHRLRSVVVWWPNAETRNHDMNVYINKVLKRLSRKKLLDRQRQSQSFYYNFCTRHAQNQLVVMERNLLNASI